MNRRDAFKALAGVPVVVSSVSRIKAEDLKPTDVIVLEVPGQISFDTAERIKAYIRDVWPDHKAVVLADGMHLRIVSID